MQEFIYGPDYVDEHIAVQSAGQTTLVIQDPGYNIVALVDFLGGGLVYQSLQTPYGHFHYIENAAIMTVSSTSQLTPPCNLTDWSSPHPFRTSCHDGILTIADENGPLEPCSFS